jgi:hypothetical protein
MNLAHPENHVNPGETAFSLPRSYKIYKIFQDLHVITLNP